MFDHVTIRASDREASERFYDTVLRAPGTQKTYSGEHGAEWGDFSLAQASEEKPVTRRLHVGFAAPSRVEVDEFWRLGTEAGYRSDGEPGLRPEYEKDYYGAFLLDPDGNSAEAVHHSAVRGEGIDHLWIRVADTSVAKRFYELVARRAGFRLQHDSEDGAHFLGEESSFSLVKGEPTENVHIAFPANENVTVDEFHRSLVEAGYRDNGAPGERAIYHPGYYGAFILDPDDNNIELVNHNR